MNKQNILIIVFVLALLGAVYNFYQSSTISPVQEAENEASNDLVKDLSKIRKLKESRLDISIFENSVFKNLESAPELIRRALPTGAEAAGLRPGRANPFLPFRATPTQK